jgi:PAS domain S-box-containing protein
MDSNIIKGLVCSVSLLLTLSIVCEIGYVIPSRWKWLVPYINGLFISIICVSIMSMPFQLTTGLFFDTRTILIGVTAVAFGGISTLIAVCVTVIYRFSLGGVGVWMGVLTICASAALGLLWRQHLLHKKSKYRWLNTYLFGIAVHVTMLASTFVLPWPLAIQTFSQLALPVMLIFPIGTVLLSMLLMWQKERNEATLQIKEAEGRYKSLFNNNHAVMMLIDPVSGQIVDANPAACSFYGWQVDEIKNMNICNINTLPTDEIAIEMKQSTNENRNYFLFKHRKASGEIVDVEVYSGPIKLNGQTLIYSIVHDITSRIAADLKLQESENRFRSLVEGAPDAIFIETESKFAFLNKAALDLFGAISTDELIGTPVMDRFHPDFHNIIQERIEKLKIDKEAVPPNEEVFLKLNGIPISVDATAVPINYEKRDGAIVFARDISERKKLEKQKTEIESQLRQQQKLEAIGTLAGGVAHEINNPLNGIMNYAQLIVDEVEENISTTQYAREIIVETERISIIVKNLLQFSRQEKQSHSYASIYDIINQTVSLIRTIIKKDQIDLEINLDDGLPDIKCRSQQIQQVLMNLLTNARDALNEKYSDYNADKIIRLTCKQYTHNDRRWINIDIEDHGIGIPKKYYEKIFEPFFSTKPKDKGTGLGLSISFGIIKDHHGKIEILSEEGRYTHFLLDLPVDNGWTV